MAWTVNTFLSRYPEFQYAGGMIQLALDAAVARVSESHFGPLTDEVVGLMAAIDLAGSPFAQTQKLEGGEERLSSYKARLEGIKLERHIGIIVL